MSSNTSPTMLPTPFHLRTARLSLDNEWQSENGWTKASYYTDPLEEYWVLRNAVGVYDLTGLIHYRVAGPDATAFLDYVTTTNIGVMADGTAQYVLWCDDKGTVVGDGVLYRLQHDQYRLYSWQNVYLWLADASIGFDTNVEDLSRSFAGLAIQGPDSRSLLQAMGLAEAASLKPLHVCEIEHQKIPVLIGRVSGSGELGYELFVDVNDALFLWDEVMHHRTVMASAVGVAAHRRATVEAGHPRIGIDFLGAESTTRPHRAVTPFELGYEKRVDFNKPHFIGRQALERKRGETPHQTLCGIAHDGPAAFPDSPILSSGTNVGATTSVVWSPILGRHVGFAWILNSALTAKHALHVLGGVKDELKVDQLDIPVEIVPRRFFRSPSYLETPVAVA